MRGYGARLYGLVDYKSATELDHFILFLPRECIESVLLVEANSMGAIKRGEGWKMMDIEDSLCQLGILLYMETVILPESRDYRDAHSMGPYSPQKMGRYMTYDLKLNVIDSST